jgi:hypothetical protein
VKRRKCKRLLKHNQVGQYRHFGISDREEQKKCTDSIFKEICLKSPKLGVGQE